MTLEGMHPGFEGGAVLPLPEEVRAARVPLDDPVPTAGTASELQPNPLVRPGAHFAGQQGTASELPISDTPQPPDPWSLFPEADPARQLELFSLAARWKAARYDQVSNVYKRAGYLPEHRLYSQAVLASMEQRNGDPSSVEGLIRRITKLFPVDTQELYPPALRRWQVLETMTRYWTRGPATPVTQAWERANEIISPPVTINSRSRRLREIRSVKIAQRWEATQKAWEKQREEQQQADTAQLALYSKTSEAGASNHLTYPIGQSTVSRATSQAEASVYKEKKRKKSKPLRSINAQTRAIQIIQEPITEARKASRSRLEQLDGGELVKGIIDLSRFLDTSNGQIAFAGAALQVFITGRRALRIGSEAASRSFNGLPSDYLALNSLILLRGLPVYYTDLSTCFGMDKNYMESSFSRLRQVFNMGDQNLLLKQGPGMPKPRPYQIALCLNPLVQLVDVRDQPGPGKTPRRIYRDLPHAKAKPQSRGRRQGRQYQERLLAQQALSIDS